MEQTTEQKLKMESDILALKREYKHAFESLDRVKSSTAEILATRDRLTVEIDQRNQELTEVLNEISNEKLAWALKKQSDLDGLSEKNAQAENVLKRKAELNTQEESIRQSELRNIEILNENRRLELKIEDEKTALSVREKELSEGQKTLIKQDEIMKKDKENFKKKVVEVLKDIEKI